MEEQIPRKVYTVHDENDEPLIQGGNQVLTAEPEITILDIP